MAVTTAVVSFEAIIYVPEPNVEFTPWHDLLGMFQLAPIGWAVMGISTASMICTPMSPSPFTLAVVATTLPSFTTTPVA